MKNKKQELSKYHIYKTVIDRIITTFCGKKVPYNAGTWPHMLLNGKHFARLDVCKTCVRMTR